MDNKITKKRFADMWAYDWLKMLGLILVAVLLWWVVFDTAAPRLLAGQEFSVFIYPTVSSGAQEVIDYDLEHKDILSYDVLSKYTNHFSAKALGQLMSTRAATHDGDILIVDNFIKYDNDNKITNYGNFQGVIDGGYSIFAIDELFYSAMDYCASFAAGDEFNGTTLEIIESDPEAFAQKLKSAEIDFDKVYSAFKVRKKKDNAYKTAKQYTNGAEKDKKRIEDLKQTVLELFEVFDKLDKEYAAKGSVNPLRANYRKYSVAYHNDPEKYKDMFENEKEKTYGIDLGGIEVLEYNGEKMAREDGDEHKVGNVYRLADSDKASSEKVTLCVFDYSKYQKDLQYETLNFIHYILENYTKLFEIL